jgi:hypothetical protein
MAVPFRVGGEIPMARRRLFTDEHWASLLAPPTEEREIVRHCRAACTSNTKPLMKNNCRINMKKIIRLKSR